MASEREIAADIKLRFGNVLSQNQARQYMGVGSDKIREILEDVPFLCDTQTKRFFAIDIAKKLYSMQTIPKKKKPATRAADGKE